MAEGGHVEEVPAKLKELAGLVGRTFYDRAASIVVDMLVINSCKYLIHIYLILFSIQLLFYF